MKLRINMILQNEDREWISRGIWNRIYRQYPSLLAENEENSVENGASPSAGIAASDQFLQQQGIIFAEGIHFYKLIWMLLWWSL